MTERDKVDEALRKDIKESVLPELIVFLISDPSQEGRIIAVNHEQKESLLIQWERHAAWHLGSEVGKVKKE